MGKAKNVRNGDRLRLFAQWAVLLLTCLLAVPAAAQDTTRSGSLWRAQVEGQVHVGCDQLGERFTLDSLRQTQRMALWGKADVGMRSDLGEMQECLVLVAQRLIPTMTYPSGDTFEQETSSGDDIVCVEGEHATRVTSGTTHDWAQESDNANAVNGSHIAAIPNDGTTYNAGAADAPYVEIDIDFEATGTHYLWLRATHAGGGGGDDSIHRRLDDGTWASYNTLDNRDTAEVTLFNEISAGTWAWCSHHDWASPQRMTISVPSAGVHTLRLLARVDGLHFDRIVLTTSSTYDPSTVNGGDGPTESATASGAVSVSQDTTCRLALQALDAAAQTGAPQAATQDSVARLVTHARDSTTTLGTATVASQDAPARLVLRALDGEVTGALIVEQDGTCRLVMTSANAAGQTGAALAAGQDEAARLALNALGATGQNAAPQTAIQDAEARLVMSGRGASGQHASAKAASQDASARLLITTRGSQAAPGSPVQVVQDEAGRLVLQAADGSTVPLERVSEVSLSGSLRRDAAITGALRRTSSITGEVA